MNVPKLRFKEFDGEIKKYKIKEVFNVQTGLTPLRSNLDYFSPKYISWIKTLDLNDSLIYETDEHVSELALSKTSLKIVPPNTVLIAMYGGFNQIGRTGLTTVEATTNQAISALIPNENMRIHPYFIQTYLNAHKNYWKSLAASSRKDPNITKKDIEKFSISIPEFLEQQKLGEFFGLLNKKIQLQQQKIDLLQEQKKGYMQKIFSKQVALKRKWVTYKFKDMIENIRGGGTPSKEIKEYYEGNIPWITVKDLKDFKYIIDSKDHITEKALENSSSKLIDVDDLIIPTRMAVGKFFISKNKMAINQDLKGITLKSNFDVEFVYYLLISQAHRLDQLSSGSTVSGINVDDLKGLELTCPSLSEQVKVAKILSLLDFKIDLNKKKLSNILKQKQGFMQQMFI